MTEEKKTCYRVDMVSGAQQIAVGTNFWPLKTLFPNGSAVTGQRVKVKIGIVK